MNDKEREVFSYMVKEKYKYYKVWKTLAIVFMCISAILAILYFSSGYVFTSRIIKSDNNVEIENDGSNNENSNNGNIVIEKQNDSTGGVVIISSTILAGGIIGGCYIISSRNNNRKK